MPEERSVRAGVPSPDHGGKKYGVEAGTIHFDLLFGSAHRLLVRTAEAGAYIKLNCEYRFVNPCQIY